uniref:Putative 3-oxoacyl coa thiolase n=1 Tax=Rhodnius neglectus TaxID=72488 RepID=A0A0P4VQQ6_9HEMI
MSDINKVVIVGAVRTPIGSLCGTLSSLKASELGSIVLKEVLKKASFKPEEVNEVIMGQALMAGEGQNPARQAAMKANIPFSVPAFTVNHVCGSGLKSVVLGYQSIVAGDSKVVLCGGQESMSRAPHSVYMRASNKMGDATLKDTLIFDGLTDAFHDIHMGITAENIAREKNISRSDQDLFAAKSQQKAELARLAGHFQEEIVPVIIESKKGQFSLDQDEFPKPGTSAEVLSKLRPAFQKDGTVTAGNSSGINDGAAALLLTTAKEAKSRGLTILGEIIGWSQAGVDPALMGLGPIPAINSLLKKIGWTKEEVDLFELNEAFAAQSLAVIRELKLNEDKVNVCGGGIALGHPIGASGARVLVTLLHGLRRMAKTKGIAALCIGGGQGIAIAVRVPT